MIVTAESDEFLPFPASCFRNDESSWRCGNGLLMFGFRLNAGDVVGEGGALGIAPIRGATVRVC